jgi:vacuolar protein sorting-associated protein 13A/C
LKCRFQWAAGCVLGDIRAREQRWKWEYIKQRRDDRISYVALYSKLKLKKKLEKTESESLSKLQEKLSFEDIL